MSLVMRQVIIDDAEGITNVLNPIILEGLYTVLDTIFTVEEEKEFIAQFPERGVFTVAVRAEGSKVIGFQNVEPFASYTKVFDHVGIIGTFVCSSCRGQGVSKQLFESTFAVAKLKGYEKLFAYVRSDNDRALAAYIKQGFEVVGIAKKHAKVAGKYIDEILIEKFL
ncbi:GNAT family N-acetyltransferase [Photobacterium kishitanii]|uniref:GNAT family N-acetyltransferase n=1 Tax=Photobacterium kishitanii TaxID=318456 RepID=A0A2T3KGR6_9GAMM|nr:GNAT family N-acetyltransferase [Photobacterium kishitanii]KJG09053.1 histone acetyltransferase [Photobacterium kishitanii]OBU25384.1 histone acetyltransferase [Photobacterium kishitanii]PSU20473.1 GNAT family N-acetyltransferase [Photobacterium kishitanii]PSU90831.1 GNAT family N-acetyltransferase [Photobacterium kishitanii]PSU95488.1 GNAT family N-acetyltransferase [Photobacterium kishitanii]